MESIISGELPSFDAHFLRVLIDNRPDLESQFGLEVPVLFVNGRKAFKYRCSSKELHQRLLREARR
jgi:hypothetical protein